MDSLRLVNDNRDLTMTSLDIAELTGKRHADIMRDIRSEINELGTEIGERIFAHTSYKDKSNRDSPCYNLGKEGAMQLALKYDAKTRYKVIKRIEELENEQQHSYMFDDPIKRAQRWIKEQQEKELLVKEKNSLLEENTMKDKIIEEQQPKVLFAESVEASEDTITIGQLSKLISQNGVNIGRTRLFQWLRENKYLIDSNGDDYNVPTQYTMERGWFEVKESTFRDVYGKFQISFKVRVTGKGQHYFVNKFIKTKSIMSI